MINFEKKEREGIENILEKVEENVKRSSLFLRK